MKLINGNQIARKILSELSKDVARLSFQPVFCDVLVGKDPVSKAYVNMKAQKAESIGVKFLTAEFPADIGTEQLIKEIKKIQTTKDLCGLIVQLPLPAHIDKSAVLDSVEPVIDVDCLSLSKINQF